MLQCCRIGTLERCLRRLEWEKARDKEARAVADQQEADRLAMQAIDWCARLPWPQGCVLGLSTAGLHLERCLNIHISIEGCFAKQQVLVAVRQITLLPCDTCVCVGRHDFTVVETIDFFADEEDELPAPMTKADVLVLNKADGFPEDEAAEAAEEAGSGPQVGLSAALEIPLTSLASSSSRQTFA